MAKKYKIKQKKFKKMYRWKCPKCNVKNYRGEVPWHDDHIVCNHCYALMKVEV